MKAVGRLAAMLIAAPVLAHADLAADADQCRLDAGTFVAGTVIRAPRFVPGRERRRGVYLSHTRLTVRATDGHTYDVAVDNVFANGYRRNQPSVPAPLDTIRIGDRLEMCGQPFPSGIHWVHTNCGARPVPERPNGWIRKVDTTGTAGENMEAGKAVFPPLPD